MSGNGILQILLFFALVLALVKPIGIYLERVFSDRPFFMDKILGPVERLLYRLAGVNPSREQHWRTYTISMLVFSLAGVLLLYAILQLQALLPFNPQHLPGLSADLAFNTATSFVSNTNWQSYSGETVMSYFSQMAGLTVQNFLSAAVGISLAVALIRGFTRSEVGTIGNFWRDMVRCTLYILLPLCIIYALALVCEGVPQNMNNYVIAHTVEGMSQVIPQGPVASQEAIKMLGTNGGGFFNANSAHPYENPTPFTNLLQMVSIFALGGGLTYTFGRMAGSQKQGWAIFAAMSVLFFMGVALLYPSEAQPTVALSAQVINAAPSLQQAGGNMEGKEVRFGIANSALFANVTTDASCGAVNGMHDSFTPLGGLVPMLNIQLGEVIFGGVGSGLYGMLLFAVLCVFIAGLMVGRTPEYLGKKIEAPEMKMTVLALILVLPLTLLGFSALASVTAGGIKGPLNFGPHGFSEILYAFTSATGNNGSAFAGLSANTPFYNIALGIAMLAGRFLFIVPAMAVAGSMAIKKRAVTSVGTFPTTGVLWVVLLVSAVLIVGGLTYFPALALGPLAEHLFMTAGRFF